MANVEIDPKLFIVNEAFSLYHQNAKEIANILNISVSLVYKYIKGKRNYEPLDRYFSTLIFNTGEMDV